MKKTSKLLSTHFSKTAIHAKCLAKGKLMQRNWTRLENFGIFFYVIFNCYCLSFIFGREIGHKVMDPLNLDIFIKFHYIIIYQDSTFLSFFRQLVRQLIMKICFTGYQVEF